jgi:hypothetical protein
MCEIKDSTTPVQACLSFGVLEQGKLETRMMEFQISGAGTAFAAEHWQHGGCE